MKMEGEKCSKVKVHSILSVVSSKPIEPGMVHKLSLLDQAMGHHTLHVIFYYNSNPFMEGPMSTDLENLRISLSGLLDQYPNVTGRLTRDKDGGFQVKCNDAGVRMLQANVDSTIDEWLRFADAVQERDLTVWEDMPQDPSFWSPFRIQINNFKCGGLAIGLSCSHMNADITSMTMLIKSWTQAHRGQTLTHSPTFHRKTSTNSIINSSLFIPNDDPDTKSPSKMVTVTMKFSDASIKKCLSKVKNSKATSFDVLVALLWPRIVFLQEPLLKDHKNEHNISICVDLRNHGVPSGYFGNAVHLSSLSLDNDELFNDGLFAVTDHIHNLVEGVKGDGFFEAMNQQLKSLKDEGKGQPHRMYGSRLTCVNGEHLVDGNNGIGIMYNAIFEKEERPVHVSYYVGNVEGEGLIMVMPSNEVGFGRTVTMTLPEEVIFKLSKDEAILELEPVMVFNGKK